jgi:hypothetical protein
MSIFLLNFFAKNLKKIMTSVPGSPSHASLDSSLDYYSGPSPSPTSSRSDSAKKLTLANVSEASL